MTAYFFSGTMEDKKKWHTIFQMLKGKICQPRKFITSENIFQEIRSNQAILRQRKTKKPCYQETYPERIITGNSLNREAMIKEGIGEL